MPTRVRQRSQNAESLGGPAHEETTAFPNEFLPSRQRPSMTSQRRTLAPPAERRAALDAVHGSWTPRTLAQHLDAMVELFADDPFIITDDQTWTYRQIQDWSVRLAGGLHEMGIRKGEHVVVVMANHPEFVAFQVCDRSPGGDKCPCELSAA